jgi:hypothetical protein
MAEFPGRGVRQYIGKSVHIALADGRDLDGDVISFVDGTIWLVSEGEDHFVAESEVILLVPTTTWTMAVPH